MRRQIAAALCAPALAVIALSSIATAQHKTAKICADERHAAECRVGPGKAAKDRRIYSTIKDIMESVIDPSADTLWGAVGTVMDKQGIRDLIPKSAEEWRDVRRAAVRIIEGANLLMMPGREAAPAGTQSEAPGVELEPAEIAVLIRKKRKSFDAYAQALQGLGAEALRAGEAKNADLLIEIGGRMEDVCESCHKTFWYPLEQRASTRN